MTESAQTAASRRTAGVQIAVAAVGLALTVAAASVLDLPGPDTTALLGMAAGGAAAAGVVGTVLLRAMRTAPLRMQAVAVALVAVVGTAVGVLLAASSMFVSSHDLGALLVVLTASTTAAVVLAVRFGTRISTASRDLEDLARRLGDGDLVTVGDVPVADEMRRLATELTAASTRLDDARRKERAMESARRELVAWVSHDLRTPLAGIRAMVEALEDGIVRDPGEVARYHATIRGETERLARLVDDLFELSRIQAGALDLVMSTVSVQELIEEAVAGAVPLADQAGVTIRGEGLDDHQTVIAAVPEMTRVLRNLLDNAIRHTPTGGVVEVGCAGSERAVEVSVGDACGGIPPDELPRVFDLAFRGDAARSSDADRGGGLGLAIARGLVEAQGGRISVLNERSGCRFTVTMPRPEPFSG